MNVLVTGGAGYIGSHVVQQLGREGWPVVTLDNLSRGFAQAVTYGPLVVGDIADRALVEVEGQPEGAVLELEQLVDGGVGQAADAGDAVAHLDDLAHLVLLEGGRVPLEPPRDGGKNVAGVDRQLSHDYGSLA